MQLQRDAVVENIVPADLRATANASYAVAGIFAATAALTWLTPYVWYAWFFAPASAAFGGRFLGSVRAVFSGNRASGRSVG